MSTERPNRIYVLAGVNGSGKGSIGGAMIRAAGADYYNPDEAAVALIAANPGLEPARANAAAWRQGIRLLGRAIDERLDYAFETTLGGRTITRMLTDTAIAGTEVRIFYVGLSSPELNIQRVLERYAAGGHDIPEADIRRRWYDSRMNFIRLLPVATEVRVYDNSEIADPKEGQPPRPILVLHVNRGEILGPPDLAKTPAWARPIVAAALKLN